jgi:hypothetical protein
MLRIAFSLLIALLLTGCSSPRSGSSIPVETQTAMSQLCVGMTEDSALAIMKPVALDSGRVTWGGTGRGVLYFQVSATQQFYLEVGPGPDFKITRVGELEPKRRWIRDSNGGISVE